MGATIKRNSTGVDPQIASKGYVHPEVLVSTEWLADHLDDPSIRIIESDEDVLLYDTGHCAVSGGDAKAFRWSTRNWRSACARSRYRCVRAAAKWSPR